MNLYEISQELLAALENVRVEEDGTVLGLMELDAIGTNFTEKAEAVALYIKNQQALADGIAYEVRNLTARKKAIDSRLEYLKRYLTTCLNVAGREQLETAKVRLSFRKSERVIADIERIPAEYVRTRFVNEIDKTAIKEAIKNGATIEGAALVTVDNIQIK